MARGRFRRCFKAALRTLLSDFVELFAEDVIFGHLTEGGWVAEGVPRLLRARRIQLWV